MWPSARRRPVTQLRSTDHPPCVSESAKHCAYGSRSERRQTCSRSCFPKGWRWRKKARMRTVFQKQGRERAPSGGKEHVSCTHQLRDKDKRLGFPMTALTCWSEGGGRLSGDDLPFPVLLQQLWTLLSLQPSDEFVESGCQGQHSPIPL